MSKLNWKQLVLAIALGVLCAALQGEPPVRALAPLSQVACHMQSASPQHC